MGEDSHSRESSGPDPSRGLEGLSARGLKLQSLDAAIHVKTDLKRRTVLIEVYGRQSGTGVLVGPDLVLTAQHVIAPREEILAPPEGIAVVFDFISGLDRSPAEAGARRAVSAIICSSPPTPGERTSSILDWNASTDYLDFAILRLAEPPPETLENGRIRMYYPVARTEYAFSNATKLLVAHLGAGASTVLYTEISAPPEVNPNFTRIRYRCDTTPGASGAPVVDDRGRLVAIHHYSTGLINQGIPVATIVGSLADTPRADLFDTMAENLRHIRPYTSWARDIVCAGLAEDWQTVAKELNAPSSVDSINDLWQWLLRAGKMHRLRPIFLALGYLELVDILDTDTCMVVPPELGTMPEDAQTLNLIVAAAQGIREPFALISRIGPAREITYQLHRAVVRLPQLGDEKQLPLHWRMQWGGATVSAVEALATLKRELPEKSADAESLNGDLTEITRHATDVGDAIAQLGNLILHWPLLR